MKRSVVALLVLTVLLALPAMAQQTTGTISGRITDQQGAIIPGATVTAVNPATGFTRTVVSDSQGIYSVTALLVGTYDLKIELAGFQPLERKGLVVSVSQNITVDLQLSVAAVAENVTVTGQTPLIETTSSSVGGVVDTDKIEALPLNGRQFANLAMTIAGVGMGFHSDPTKSTQYSPQVAGGNGRNVNYQIDGGDNNDDTVGGLLQLFPLEAIQEFNMITSRYKAEYGRSNGGVMNIVTKSGTNRYGGSWFTLFRDKSLNAMTESEKLSGATEKNDYRRYQFGGSFGGPIMQNKAHFFFAAERTQQDTTQIVDTFGMFPSEEGPQNIPMRENLFTVKGSVNATANQYLTVRYGRNTNSQVYNASKRSVPDNWGDSKNTFNSVNVNHNWVLGGSKLNEFIFQYADFLNNITARSNNPQESFPNGVTIGYNSNTPQTTAQHKWQFRDDFSWHVAGKGGIGHDLKTGVNFIYEPRLYITFNAGSGAYSYTHLDNTLTGPISAVGLGSAGAGVNLPMKQWGMYFQDDWRVTDRLTVNAGLRYDIVTGFAINQAGVTNFDKLQAAGAAGYFNGVPAFEDWGKTPKEDYNNIQPRVGFAWDVKGDGKDVVRGGWGIYYDFGYTNANILFAALNTVGGQGSVYSLSGYTTPRKSGTCTGVTGVVMAGCVPFFVGAGDPRTVITDPNESSPTGPYYNSHVASPRILQPYTNQWSAGWSHQITASTVFDVDYVGTRGHDLGVRWPLNTKLPDGTRRFASLGLTPASPTFDLSVGASRFDGVTFGVRRRMDKHFSFNAWYMLARADGLGGLGIDELTTNLVQDATKPYADVQWGPAGRTDSRHKVTISAVFEVPWGISIAPMFRYRSALPLHIWQGIDLNADGATNDIAAKAYEFTGLDANNKPTYKEIGACTNVNCGRGAALSQFNFRVAKTFALPANMHIEVIGEVFNLFNAINPAFGSGAASSSRLLTGTGAPNASFMVPTAYAGDTGQPEQRVGQIGFRFTF
jgi:outer membrane receptor protein involved in Fe transport